MDSEIPTNSKTSSWSSHDYDSRVSDLTLLVESCEFRVHKDVLQRSCDYFRAMFSSQMVETSKEVITLQSFMAEPCKVLFEGFYTGRLLLTETNIFSVTETAHMFHTYATLLSQCTQYLTNLISLKSVFDIMHFSGSLCLKDVYSSARKFSLGHFMEMSCSSSFLGLSVPELCDYLSDKYLAAEEEVHVVRAVSSWLEHNENDKLTRSMVQQIVNACLYMKHDCGGSEAITGHLTEVARGRRDLCLDLISCYLTERTKPKDLFLFWSQLEPSHYDGLADIIKVSPATWEVVKFDQMTDIEQRPGYDMGSAICTNGCYVFLSGGGSKFGSVLWIKNIWCFDFSAPAPRWKVVAGLKETRRHHAMVAVGGRLYLFGGFGKFRCKNTKLECFDLGTGTWENLPEMPIHEVNPVTAVHQHNIFYIEKQWNILCFDSNVKQWKQFELNLSIPRNDLPVSLHIDPRTPDTFLALFREWTKFNLKSLQLNTCVEPGALSGITCVELGAWEFHNEELLFGSVVINNQVLMFFESAEPEKVFFRVRSLDLDLLELSDRMPVRNVRKALHVITLPHLPDSFKPVVVQDT